MDSPPQTIVEIPNTPITFAGSGPPKPGNAAGIVMRTLHDNNPTTTLAAATDAASHRDGGGRQDAADELPGEYGFSFMVLHL